MKKATIAALLVLACSPSCFPQEQGRHIFICRSPLLAFDFWISLKEVEEKGVKVTPKIAEQVCARMRAGTDPQCLEIKVNSIKPIAAGWQGSLAITDGKQKVWFHNPDTGG